MCRERQPGVRCRGLGKRERLIPPSGVETELRMRFDPSNDVTVLQTRLDRSPYISAAGPMKFPVAALRVTRHVCREIAEDIGLGAVHDEVLETRKRCRTYGSLFNHCHDAHPLADRVRVDAEVREVLETVNMVIDETRTDESSPCVDGADSQPCVDPRLESSDTTTANSYVEHRIDPLGGVQNAAPRSSSASHQPR